MNRTKGIFLLASVAVGLAVVLSVHNPGTALPPPKRVNKTPPPPKDPSASTKTVAMSARVSHPYVAQAEATDVFMQVDLRGRDAAKRQRMPLNIALVIDRSGSMAGRKLAHAKLAARRLVERLHDGDRIAIITYGSDVTTLVPSTPIDATSRANILGRIHTILDRGGTFLSGGLAAAVEALTPSKRPEQVTRVILISDGQANEGITSKLGLTQLARKTSRKGISVTTMGVGLDFNEDVMTAIAEHGSGHYYFINDSSSLAGIFKRELNKLMSTVARSPRLQITLEPGVSLLALYGYEYVKHGNRLTVTLPEVFARQKRRVTLKLRVSPAVAKRRPLARVELTYRGVDSRGGVGPLRTLVNAVDVAVTSDPNVIYRHLRKDVMARGQQVEIARDVKSALTSYGAGDVAGARARLKRRLRRAVRANAKLGSAVLGESIKRTRHLLGRTTAVQPASPAGRRAIKAGKADAYKMAK